MECQQYLKDYKRPPVLPITRYAEGKEAPSFLKLFGPARWRRPLVVLEILLRVRAG